MKRNCIACSHRIWKQKMAECIWEIIAMNNKPTIEIEKTKKFSVLSVFF